MLRTLKNCAALDVKPRRLTISKPTIHTNSGKREIDEDKVFLYYYALKNTKNLDIIPNDGLNIYTTLWDYKRQLNKYN